jgi:peptidoglycan/xylan/chitin deacetylase (PgdA/CDA1 family)
MRVPGWKRIRQGARWVRSRFSSGAVVIGYHRIAEDANDAFSQCVRPQYFAEHLQVLKKQANPITLDELPQYLHSNTLPPRSVVITFDDGYADNLYQACPLLAQHGIPATFFITTGSLGKHFWWDQLAWLILDTPNLQDELSIVVNGQTASWSLSGQDRNVILIAIYRRLLHMTDKSRVEVMAQLYRQLGGNGWQPMNSGRALTAEELGELATGELVSIGAHTVSHPVLTSIPQESQRYEIERSKLDLEAILGRRVSAFSYPNGAGSEATKTLLQQNGFDIACSSFNDVAHRGSSPLWLPRFWAQDQGGSEFARWLNHWL